MTHRQHLKFVVESKILMAGRYTLMTLHNTTAGLQVSVQGWIYFRDTFGSTSIF